MKSTSSVSRAERRAQKEALEQAKAIRHDRYVQRTYGLAPGEYGRILASQEGRCAICGKRPRTRYLAVDHDHATNRVRGLLCYVCNTSIGPFEFDPAVAARASEYLAKIARDLRDTLVEPSRPSDDLRVPGDLPF